jgi:hypothetical protein
LNSIEASPDKAHCSNNSRCNNDLASISRGDRQDSNKRLDFRQADPYLGAMQKNTNATFNLPPRRPEMQVPDLLGALTAQGLAGPAATPREDDSRAEYPRGAWLARRLERRVGSIKEC